MNLLKIITGITVILVFTACQTWPRFEYVQPEMGVVFRIQFHAPNNATARRAAQQVYDRIEALNAIFSDYDPDSELNRLTRHPVGQPVKVSPELFGILQRAQKLARETNGAFDITAGPFTKLWRRARRQQKLTDPALLKKATQSVGYEKLRLNPANCTVTLLSENMRLDLGGIAKGWAADEALAILRKHNLHRALCAASGDIAIGQPPPGKIGWRVSIRALDQQGNFYTRTLHLKNCAISTSGDTIQFIEIDGKRYSHIVDPRTGHGLTTRIMVTVIADSATETDSQATAISVLGIENGIKFAGDNRLAAIITPMDAEGKEAKKTPQWRLIEP